MTLVDHMRIKQAEKAAASSPTGTAFECSKCFAIMGEPQRHYAMGTVECPGGEASFAPFVAPVPDAEPPPNVPVFRPPPKMPRAAPSTRAAESVECPSCHSLPGDRCRNYRGKGCAPHRQRIEAAK